MGMLRWGETFGFLEIEGGEEISGFDSKDRIGPGREVTTLVLQRTLLFECFQ